MKICFKNAQDYTDILSLCTSGASVASVNFYNTVFLRKYFEMPKSLKAASEASLSGGMDILLHAKLDIDGDKYLSTMLFSKGQIAGVGECLSNEAYTIGSALRMYKIGGVWAGVVSDSDIQFAGAANIFYGGAKVIFHNTLDNLDKKYFAAYKAHSVLNGGTIVGLFRDGAVVCSGTPKAVDDEIEIDFDGNARAYKKSFLHLSKGE